jgi:hypothetical protein
MAQPHPHVSVSSAGLVENFTGVGRPSIEVFVKSVERAGALGDWDDAQKIGLAKLKMRGPAAEYLESDPTLDDIQVWNDFRTQLINRYKDRTTLANATNQFTACTQKPGELAADYATRLRLAGSKMLVPGANAAETAVRKQVLNEQMNAQFQRGLREGIRRFVQSRAPANLEEAIAIATQEEQNEYPSRRQINSVQPGELLPPEENTSRKAPNPSPSGSRNPFCRACRVPGHWTNVCRTHPRACYNCGRDGHMAQACRQNSRTCYNCNQPGHTFRECRRTPNVGPAPRSNPSHPN